MKNINSQNLGTKSKRIDRFYVTFYGIPENLSNVLGRQITNISRPDISFDMIQTGYRRNTFKDFGKIEFQPVNITFKDDEQSITSMFLYAQVMRQLQKKIVYLGEGDRFNIKVDFLDSTDKVTESYELIDCFISNIAHSESTVSDDDVSDISVTIDYDNINIKIFDEYIKLKQGN